MKENLKLAWRNLFRNSRRTVASLVTVAFGAAGLLIFQGFNTGIMNQYRENTIRVRYGHGQVFPKGYRDKVLEEPWSVWIENASGVEAKLRQIPHIKDVYPRVSFFGLLSKGGVTIGGRGEGTRPEREKLFFNRMNFIAGGDVEKPDEVILGKGLADSLDAHVGDVVILVGQTVQGSLNGSRLRVSGIFHTGSQDFDNTCFRIDLATAHQFLDTDKVENFTLQTDGVSSWPLVARDVANRFSGLEAISFDDLDAVYYKNSVAFLDTQFNFVRSIILLVVGLGIFNAIAVGLLERAGEVGALRANGESRANLMGILVLENTFLGLLGGVLGIAVAVVIDKVALAKGIPMPPGPGITRHFLILLEIQPEHFTQALILPAVTAVFASLWPIGALLKRKIPDLLKTA